MTEALKRFAAEMLPALEAEMRAVLAEPAPAHGSAGASTAGDGREGPAPFYGMLHYQMGWVDTALRPAGNERSQGKRIRPLLCLLACQAAAERAEEQNSPPHQNNRRLSTPAPPHHWRQALPAAAAIELLHNFSLIHDDIEDASPTRRGRPTLWKIWGMAQAINSGDALFALAHLALSRLLDRQVDPRIVVHALRRFDETCLRLTRGQHADMAFEKRRQVSVAEYIEMITGKTAVLLALSAELGALIAGAGQAVAAHYAAFGQALGLAFQVKDDILGIWGDEGRTGKSAATDIVTRKKTLPVVYGLSQSRQLQRLYQAGDGFDSGDGGQQEVVARVVQLLDQSGARDFAAARAAAYSQEALDHLTAAAPRGAAATALYELAQMLLNRDF